MSEYIERERARHECKNFFKGDKKAQDDCESLLCMLPAADVSPARRGKWGGVTILFAMGILVRAVN